MRGVDLDQFQFDFDLSMMIFFVAPDGTVLGRYCASGADRHRQNTIAGLRRAAERALELFARLDEERAGLAGKKRPSPVARVEELEHDRIRKVETGDPGDDQNCVHCHNVQEAMNALLERRRDYHPDLVAAKFPLPEQVGLEIDPDDGVLIAGVRADSAAARAGLRVGDRLLRLDGQPLISIADVTWALGAVPDPGRAVLLYEREGKERGAELELAAGWKPADLLWRVSVNRMRPFLQLWVEGADAEERASLGIGDQDMALVVRGVFGPAVRAAGIRKDDVIRAIDGRRDLVDPRRFTLFIRLNHFQRGASFVLEILRAGKTLELTVKT
ncbi:MAG: PDZ domain-containing protein [Planctomycetes bacterium]|nr:PDZ domain-containing protein [Planctomycetota bacterium]